jgi:hypothetical protein
MYEADLAGSGLSFISSSIGNAINIGLRGNYLVKEHHLYRQHNDQKKKVQKDKQRSTQHTHYFCRCYSFVLLSSFITYRRIFNKSKTTGATNGAGTTFIPLCITRVASIVFAMFVKCGRAVTQIFPND